MHNKEYRPTLAQLRTFVTVAENKHFGTAAAKLEISQPSLSQGLVALEQGLGLQLIERSTRKVIVTSAGETLLPYAKATLEAADTFLAHARGANGTLAGPLTIGTAEITEKPEKVVTLGQGSTETSIALGTIPVGMEEYAWAADDSGYTPWANEAVKDEGGKLPEFVGAGEELDMEKILELEPDVILAPWSGITQEQYDSLSEIAPTVAYPDQAWSIDWDEQIEIIGKALGQEDDAAELVDALARSAGVPTVVDAVARDFRLEASARTGWPFTRWVRALRPAPLRRLRLDREADGAPDIREHDVRAVLGRSSIPPPAPAARAAVDLAARRIGTAAGEGLPTRWADAVADAARPVDGDLADALDQAVVRTPLRGRKPLWWAVAGLLQVLLAVAAVAGLLWLVVVALAGWLQLPEIPTADVGPFATPFLLLVGAGRQDLRALELGLVGHARNMRDGRVEVVAQGDHAAIGQLEGLLREDPSTAGRPGRVDAVVRQEGDARPGIEGFVER